MSVVQPKILDKTLWKRYQLNIYIAPLLIHKQGEPYCGGVSAKTFNSPLFIHNLKDKQHKNTSPHYSVFTCMEAMLTITANTNAIKNKIPPQLLLQLPCPEVCFFDCHQTLEPSQRILATQLWFWKKIFKSIFMSKGGGSERFSLKTTLKCFSF